MVMADLAVTSLALAGGGVVVIPDFQITAAVFRISAFMVTILPDFTEQFRAIFVDLISYDTPSSCA